MADIQTLSAIARLLRYYILISTTAAGSGHPTTSLSAVELMAALFFGGILHFDLKNSDNPSNDRVIFSKGHGSPLLYALYAVAGVLSKKELLQLRMFNSPLEGHPTPRFRYTEAATGSLGQGLSVGVGMALAIKLKAKKENIKVSTAKLPCVYVLLGDSEMAEGQVWEAMELAGHYKLNNLIGMIDVNRLGQRGETMLGWNVEVYARRVESFGWKAIVVSDGHDVKAVLSAYKKALTSLNRPVMIVAKTMKGKGVSFLEGKDGWHGKAVGKDKLEAVLNEIGMVDETVRGVIESPPPIFKTVQKSARSPRMALPHYTRGEQVAVRAAYGDALAALGRVRQDVVVLDAEVSNSTYAERFQKTDMARFFEMYIAEQNMVSAALGFARRGYVPFTSSFAAFLTRAFDQIRMAQYSNANLKLVGSHAGVSIGSDGSSQMALEDLSMMRSVLESVVLYPSDAVSAYKLVEKMYKKRGMVYMRTTREAVPVLYKKTDSFTIGGSKVWGSEKGSRAIVIAAGITLHEALKAQKMLQEKGVNVIVVDLYSVKPLDEKIVKRLAQHTKRVVTVEDHYPYGGIGEAVNTALVGMPIMTVNLAVHKIPRSATPQQLLSYEEIDAAAIVKAVQKLLKH